MAEPGAAVSLGDRGADPAHLGDLAPQRGIVAGIALERAARLRQRVALGEEAPRLFAQLLQLVGEIEVHLKTARAEWRRHR